MTKNLMISIPDELHARLERLQKIFPTTKSKLVTNWFTEYCNILESTLDVSIDDSVPQDPDLDPAQDQFSLKTIFKSLNNSQPNELNELIKGD